MMYCQYGGCRGVQVQVVPAAVAALYLTMCCSSSISVWHSMPGCMAVNAILRGSGS